MRVELQDIHKWFGPVHANDGINLVFEPGTIYAVLGENGAGKSTLMKILSGYQQPSSGTILIDGKPVSFNTPIDALQAGVGMLYQDPADFPPLRVVENHLLAYDDDVMLEFKEAEHTLGSYSQNYGFTVDPGVHVDSLTLGERQQMELMRLLALGADLLILDEPTTGISAVQQETLFATIRRLAHEEGKTIVLVSHKLEEVQELCDRIAVLRSGKLVGTRDLPAPMSDLVRMMFGEEAPRQDHYPSYTDKEVLTVDKATFGTYLLTCSGINLVVREGEVLGLAGLEGSGQRELLQACAGLLPLQEGQVLLDGKPLLGKRSPFSWMPTLALIVFALWIIWTIIQRITGQIGGLQLLGGIAQAGILAGAIWLIGAILIAWTGKSAYHEFQERGGAYVPAGRLEEALIPGLTLTEHMALVKPDSQFFVDWNDAKDDISRRIEHYRVIGRPDTLVNNLSGGNQQRAMLALLKTPLRVLLLEHPTRGLDVTSANWMWELFRRRREQGTAIIFMSADLDELMEHSDRIAVFSGGVMQRVVNARETSVEETGHLIGGVHA